MRHLEEYEHQFLKIIAEGLKARARSKVEGRTIVVGSKHDSDNESDQLNEREVIK